MTLNDIVTLWNDFWFRPISPASICVFRVFYGLLAFSCGLFWLPYALTWFGHNGIVTIATVQSYGAPRLSLLLLLNPNDTAILLLLAIYMLASFCLTLGLFTRISTIITWLLLVSFQNRNPFCLGGGDYTLLLVGFFLIFAPAGAMYSIDAFLKHHQGTNSKDTLYYPWAQRLLQLLLVSIYWQSFWSKINNINWLQGTAMYYVTHCAEYMQISAPYIFDHLWICKLLTWATLPIEFSLCTLIWIKEFRYIVIVVGILFHLTIDWLLLIPMFEYVMIALYLPFIDPLDMEHAVSRVGLVLRHKLSWRS